VSKKGDEALYTCLLDRPLSPEEIEDLRAWNGVVAAYALEPILDYRLRDAVPLFSTVEGMLAMGEKEGASIPQLAIMYERRRSGLSESEIRAG